MEKLFLGIKGHVLCLNKSTGKELWRTKLKLANITNVLYEGDFVFAYTGGHFFCLNSNDGKIIWKNGLNEMGYGPCIIASDNQGSAMMASQLAAQQTQAAIGGAIIGGSSGVYNNWDNGDGGGGE